MTRGSAGRRVKKGGCHVEREVGRATTLRSAPQKVMNRGCTVRIVKTYEGAVEMNLETNEW